MTTQDKEAVELSDAIDAWLAHHNLDYSKYGDKRKDRSAYDTMMNYEVSDLLAWAFECGVDWQKQRERPVNGELEGDD